jgi:hypothetical protein
MSASQPVFNAIAGRIKHRYFWNIGDDGGLEFDPGDGECVDESLTHPSSSRSTSFSEAKLGKVIQSEGTMFDADISSRRPGRDLPRRGLLGARRNEYGHSHFSKYPALTPDGFSNRLWEKTVGVCGCVCMRLWQIHYFSKCGVVGGGAWCGRKENRLLEP